MASARVLTTIELGGIRYEDSKSARRWPIQVRFSPDQSDAQSYQYQLHVPKNKPVLFKQFRKGGLFANIPVQEGSVTYEIRADDGTLVSTGGLEVRPPAVPLHKNSNVAKLRRQDPSGGRQIPAREVPKLPGRATWPIVFNYGEETWAVREVYVVSMNDRFEETKLDQEESGKFSKQVELPEGIISYRFRVVFRENTRADAAPYTRLGWDDGMSDAGSLVTWPLRIVVADVGDGSAPSDATGANTTGVVKPASDTAGENGSASEKTDPAATTSNKDQANKGIKDLQDGKAPNNDTQTSDVSGTTGTNNSSKSEGETKEWTVALVGAAVAIGAALLLGLLGGGSAADGDGTSGSSGGAETSSGSETNGSDGINDVWELGQGQAA